MSSAWKFDEWNPYEDAFEESGLNEEAPGIFDVVFSALDEIESDPTRGEHVEVAGKSVYMIKTPPHPADDIPELLIAYTVDPDKSLIQPLLISRASDVSSITDELRSIIENAPVVVPRPRVVLFPTERTTIPEETLAAAVKYAIELRKSKQRQ